MDGSLSSLGIVIGAYAGTESVVIAATVGGTIANGISNALSAYSAGEAEQYTKMRGIEDAMVSKELKGSSYERKIRKSILVSSIADGLASVIGGTIPIIPFFLFNSPVSTIAACALVIAVIFIVGIYLGKVSRKNILLSALKMALFAAIIAAVVYFVQSVINPAAGA